MTAGMNSKGRIWRYYALTDDDQGGAVPTGTVIYDNVYARIAEKKSTQALLEQGLETPTILDAIFEPGNMILQSNDVYEDIYYPASPNYGKKFVIIGVHQPSMVDKRKYLSGTLRRFDEAHTENLQ